MSASAFCQLTQATTRTDSFLYATLASDIHVELLRPELNSTSSDQKMALQEALSNSIESSHRQIAAEMQERIEDIITYTYGLASYKHMVALCLAAEVRNQINYHTVHETSTRILIKALPVAIQSTKLEFPWQQRITVDEGAAILMIVRQLSSTAHSINCEDDSSRQTLFNSIAICVLAGGSERMQRLQQAQSILQHLMSTSPKSKGLEPYAAFLAGEVVPFDRGSHAIQPAQRDSFIRLQRNLLTQPETQSLIYHCPIPGCGRPVLVESLDKCPCQDGHYLATRCAITFQPVLNPKTIKYCSQCSRSFMNELTHPLVVNAEKRSDLCRLLLASFSRCPFCQGRFYHAYHNA